MKTGSKGLALIKKFEGIHDGDLSAIGLQPKMCPANIWTEGWGRAMRDDKGNFLKGIENKALAFSRATIKTAEQADKALMEDLSSREFTVMQKITVDLNQNQFDALVSYVYNTGGSSTLYNLINAKADKSKIESWFKTKYITGGGQRLQGLVNRRAEESNLYFS